MAPRNSTNCCINISGQNLQRHSRYRIELQVGLAAVGDYAVKHASHCLSLTTRVPFSFSSFRGHHGWRSS